MSEAEQYPEKIRQCHNRLIDQQASRLNEIEVELGSKVLRSLEKMIKYASKNGDGVVLEMLLTERNRVSDYLRSINK